MRNTVALVDANMNGLYLTSYQRLASRAVRHCNMRLFNGSIDDDRFHHQHAGIITSKSLQVITALMRHASELFRH